MRNTNLSQKMQTAYNVNIRIANNCTVQCLKTLWFERTCMGMECF